MLQPVYTLDGGKMLARTRASSTSRISRRYPGSGRKRRLQPIPSRYLRTRAVWPPTLTNGNSALFPKALWPRLAEIADFVCGAWRRPDHGPWEIRGKPEHYVASKALCWAALDRACLIAKRLGDRFPHAGSTKCRFSIARFASRVSMPPNIRFVRSFGETGDRCVLPDPAPDRISAVRRLANRRDPRRDPIAALRRSSRSPLPRLRRDARCGRSSPFQQLSC